jgi:mercuric ion binding protein
MKTIMKIFLFTTLLAMPLLLSAQNKNKEAKSVKFVTSMTCEDCVNTIMSNLPKEKGVKDVKCDLKTKEVTIKYQQEKTNPEQLQRSLEKLGYTAKQVKEEPVPPPKKI